MTSQASANVDVVASWDEAARQSLPPLIVTEPLEVFLDAAGLGRGTVTARPIGGGHSNVTYLVERSGHQFVLRRPPRGPLPKSTHDVLREARLLSMLAGTPARVPAVLAICDEAAVIGAPFYIMEFLDGHVLDLRLPEDFGSQAAALQIAEQLVDALVELHAVDVRAGELAAFGRPDGYLERQVSRFRALLGGATRSLPELQTVADWLIDNLPANGDQTLVHGDYRLGNVMFAASGDPQIVAVLDWEMAALGDPLADVGYLTAMWAESDDVSDPMLDLSLVTRLPHFPPRRALIDRYEHATGRDLSKLRWYQTLALWKAAIFLEGSYRRYLDGSTDDAYFARLETGVPALARRALTYTTDAA